MKAIVLEKQTRPVKHVYTEVILDIEYTLKDFVLCCTKKKHRFAGYKNSS